MLKKFASYLFFMTLFLASFAVQAEDINALLHQTSDPVAGNPKGNITIVEFFDYQCSYCMSMAPVIASIIQANPNVRVVFKEYPIRGELSYFAARAALAANKQGKYYRFNHALLMANQPLTNHFILTTAEKLGLNIPKFKKDMGSNATAREIRANLALGEQSGVNGTPAFFIAKTNAQNSRDIIFNAGAMSARELQQAINEVR